MSGRPIGSIESTTIAPFSIGYFPPTRTRGRIQMRTLQVISPRRTPSRSRLVNVMIVRMLGEVRRSSLRIRRQREPGDQEQQKCNREKSRWHDEKVAQRDGQ